VLRLRLEGDRGIIGELAEEDLHGLFGSGLDRFLPRRVAPDSGRMLRLNKLANLRCYKAR
jgi:hypothetical protein